jgi:hypothetical protein
LADNLEEARRTCEEAVKLVPADVCLRFRVLRGRPARAIGELIDSGEHRAVVLSPAWARRRALRRPIARWRAAGIDVRAAVGTQR